MPQPTTVTPRTLTFGEKAVGLTFNPGGDPQVTAIKAAYAAIIDQLNDARGKANQLGHDFQARIFENAIEHAMVAQMVAVKGITWTN